jgi:hypothetical protein
MRLARRPGTRKKTQYLEPWGAAMKSTFAAAVVPMSQGDLMQEAGPEALRRPPSGRCRFRGVCDAATAFARL